MRQHALYYDLKLHLKRLQPKKEENAFVFNMFQVIQ